MMQKEKDAIAFHMILEGLSVTQFADFPAQMHLLNLVISW